MDNHHASHAEFFEKLSSLLASPHSKRTGAVHLVQKRLSNPSNDDAVNSDSDILGDLSPSASVSILVRATNGKGKEDRAQKIKISTIVQPDDLEAFYIRYAEVCRGGMQALKKRDRKNRRKKKGKTQADGAAPQK